VLISLTAALLSACSLASPAPIGQAGANGEVVQPSAPFMQSGQPAQPMELPTRRPNAQAGAALYQEKCIRCHGASGRGDGEVAAQIQSQFGKPVADLTSDVIARARTPEAWYNIVANGNLQSGMPGFAGSLDVNQRWDVIAYAWTLAAPQRQIDLGQQVYAKQCVQCHGQTGKGDGPDAKGTLPDFTQFSTFASIEAGKLDQALASTHIPSFAGTTSEQERRAAVDYIRTLAYDYAGSSGAASAPATPVPGAAPAPTGSAAPGEAINITGYLVNGTAGQPVPGNLPITFYVFPGGTGQTAITETFQSDAEGRFVISSTQAKPGDLLAATTTYKDLNFFSELVDYAPRVTLPITVYESSPDGSGLKINTLHIVAVPGANGLEVSEIVVLNNPTDRLIAGFGQPILTLGLPKDATQFSVDTSMRTDTLVRQDNTLLYFDAVPVGDNAAQIVYRYVLPNAPYSLDRPLFQDVGSVNMLVEGEPGQVSVNSSQLTSAGVQPIQGSTYQQYRATSLTAGTNLSVSITPPGAGGLDWRIVAGIGLVVVGLGGIVLWQRGRSRAASAAPARAAASQRDALIDQIAALDDDFEAGLLDEVNYRARRAKLKEKLMKLMSDE
jgi:mono/diheme cytochrome c family protein